MGAPSFSLAEPGTGSRHLHSQGPRLGPVMDTFPSCLSLSAPVSWATANFSDTHLILRQNPDIAFRAPREIIIFSPCSRVRIQDGVTGQMKGDATERSGGWGWGWGRGGPRDTSCPGRGDSDD